MAATDLITLAEAKQEIGAISVDVDDLLLGGYISAISTLLDDRCGPIVRRTITGEIYDVPMASQIRLRTYPVSAISAVTEYTVDGVATVLASDTLTTKRTNGFYFDSGPKWARTIQRRSAGSAYTFPPSGQVEVTYVAGRCATTATVPAIFKHAARLALSTHWSIQQGSGSLTFGDAQGFGTPIPIVMPRAVELMLAAELLPAGVA